MVKLEAEVAALRDELAGLRAQVAELLKQLQ
jgi:ribosomal protein L29